MAKVRVLLVEDSCQLRQFYKEIFETAGFEVVEAADGVEAEEAMSDTRIDIVFCDNNMPRKSGQIFLAELREGENDIPFILHCAGPQDELSRWCERYGARFLPKGVGTDAAMIGAIEHTLRPGG